MAGSKSPHPSIEFVPVQRLLFTHCREDRRAAGHRAAALTLLIKALVQIKAASALGLFLLALQTLVFLAASGALGLAALAGVAFPMNRRQAQAA